VSNSEILSEAERLYNLGWGVHWLKPNSKAPVKSGWSGPVRDEWEALREEFREGYGLGVRLGESSKLGEGSFLANIDVDIKSREKRHQREALEAVVSRFPELQSAPLVKTGYGYRYFVTTAKPLPSGKLAASPDLAKVLMPSADVNRQQLRAVEDGRLSRAELDQGYRLRGAWEVEFMSSGKQVVLPPSVHPDTGRPYAWVRPVNGEAPPLVVLGAHSLFKSKGRPVGSASGKGFTPVVVDLVSSPLSDRIVGMVLTGEGVSDRSAALFAVALAMCAAKFSDAEILTVLTDQTTFLGEVAFEHAATGSRAVAADWVRRYTLAKAREETAAGKSFDDEAVVTIHLEPAEQALQTAELVAPSDWKDKLARSGKDGSGPPRDTLENIVSILANAVGPEIFRRDLFAGRDTYGCATPWGGAPGEVLTDDDAIKIKHWVGKNFRVEPSCHTVFEAMVLIATRNGYHPVRDELAALAPWDGTPRIDLWLSRYFGAKGPAEYLAQVFRKWLVASVARTYEPGLKFDWMPILEGAQGTGKSSFGAILFGQKYFADWLPVLSDKDAALGLQGIRCVEFGELDQLRRNELETTKAFVTRQVDKVRPPYGRRSLEIARQCVFFGTTNQDYYLKDDTGNRRFKPIEVGELDFSALARDREQLWAEALWIYDNRLETSLDLEGDARRYVDEYQSQKIVENESAFMVEAIRAYIRKMKNDETLTLFKFERFKLVTLFGEGAPLQKFQENSRNIHFAAKALKVIGAQKTHSKGYTWWKIDLGRGSQGGIKSTPLPQENVTDLGF
jgi:hypothetical protein